MTLAVLLLAAWLLPQFFNAERYRRRLQTRLELTLGRRVTFGAVSLHLLPRPGFSLEDVAVQEDPAFGSEPLARASQVDCMLQLRALWRGRLDCAGLRLESATLNIVRDTQGAWNVQQLLHETGMTSPAAPASAHGGPPQSLDLEADDARLNFTVGGNKKPLAITDLTARFVFDPQSHRAQFRFAGSPVRTDLSLPTPGPIALSGDWTPEPGGAGRLTATLQARGALVYDWVPLLTGHNPGIYGVLDADVRLDGSYPLLEINGQGRITQVHRWGSIPPPDSMPVTVELRGRLDRSRGRALIDAIDASFANSRVHVTGALDKIPDSPQLDLVVELERSRLEDLLALGRRLWGRPGDGPELYDLSGAANGLLTVKGSWADRRYGGSVTARDVRLKTQSGTFPVSDMALRIDDQGVRLAPVRITVAPRVEVTAEGVLHGRAAGAVEPTEVAAHRQAAHRRARAVNAMSDGTVPGYELALSAKSVPLHDLLRLARDAGVAASQEIDARGQVTAELRLAGSAWPFTRPVLSGEMDLREARLVVPGLTEPIDFGRTRVEIAGNHVTVNPLSAGIGATVFAGRLEHEGAWKRPWKFDLQTGKLSLDQDAAWFDALAHPPRFQVLDYIPGLRSLAARRSAGASLFGALNAEGRFAAGTLSYRSLTLSQLSARVEISGRVVRASSVTFKAAGGSGRGGVRVDLTAAPAKISGSAALTAANVQTWADYLPPQLRKARGLVTGSVRFQTRGLSRPEMRENLEGEADVQVKDIFFGDFDPLAAAARAAGWGTLAPERTEAVLRSADASLTIANRRVSVKSRLPLGGAQFVLAGTYNFDGDMDAHVRADFAHVNRRWSGTDTDPVGRVALLHLTGPLDRPTVVPDETPLRANR